MSVLINELKYTYKNLRTGKSAHSYFTEKLKVHFIVLNRKLIFDHFSHDSSLIHSSSLSIPVFIISKNHSWPIPCMRFKSILIAEKFDADHVSHLPHNDHCYIYICRFIEFNPKPILMVILFYSY